MKKILLSCALVLMVLSTSSWAEDKPRAAIIFDASGSMWGQINGKPKISIAKEALKKVVKDWNPSVELGLTVYGHRTNGDCSDIETVIPVGKLDKNKILSVVKGIQPKGKTPISRTLKKVAQEIKYTEEKATIILISDGKESCNANPCATAKALDKAGVDFIAHVIGFNVDKNTDKQLSCIASVTGGEYFSAKNADALNDAMQVIAKKVEKVEKIEPKPKPVTTKNNLKVYAILNTGGKKVKTYQFKVYRVSQDEFGKPSRKSVTSSNYNVTEATFVLPHGDYIIAGKMGKASAEATIKIEAGKGQEVELNYNAGKLKASAILNSGGNKVKTYQFKVYRTGQEEFGKSSRESVTSSNYNVTEANFILPQGDYIIVGKMGKASAETTVKIEAGKGQEVELNYNAGKLRTSAILNTGGKKVKTYQFKVYRMAQDEFGKSSRESVTSSNYNVTEANFILPQGDYIITGKIGKASAEATIQIEAGKGQEVELNYNAGKLRTLAILNTGGKKVKTYQFKVYRTAQDEFGKPSRERVTSSNYNVTEANFILPVGEYIVTAINGDKSGETPVTIIAGKGIEVEVLLKPK